MLWKYYYKKIASQLPLVGGMSKNIFISFIFIKKHCKAIDAYKDWKNIPIHIYIDSQQNYRLRQSKLHYRVSKLGAS